MLVAMKQVAGGERLPDHFFAPNPPAPYAAERRREIFEKCDARLGELHLAIAGVDREMDVRPELTGERHRSGEHVGVAARSAFSRNDQRRSRFVREYAVGLVDDRV